MIKSELINKLGLKQDHLAEHDVAISVNTILDSMIDALCQGQRIEIRDFGNFDLHYRSPRKAHNPKTGEKLVTEPKFAVHFKAGKGLKDRVDASKDKPIQHDADEV
jgi:integration host factor subunit beta